MRCSDPVNIALFHKVQIHAHLFFRTIITRIRITVMTIDAPDLDGLTIHFYNAILNADTAKSDLFSDHFSFSTYGQIVKSGFFRIPSLNNLQFSFKGFAAKNGFRKDFLSLRGTKLYTCISPFHKNAEFPFCRGMNPIVRDPFHRSRNHINIPKNAGHTDFILIFEIGTVAPFQNGADNAVSTFFEEGRHAEFGNTMRHLSITRKFPIYVEIETAVHSFKSQDSFQSIRRISIAFLIYADRILIRHIRRIVSDRIGNVCVLSLVITMKLPIRRYRDLRGKLLIRKVIFQIDHTVIISKVPCSI